MTYNRRLASLARVSFLSVALAFPVATAAYADGDFNISRESVILQSVVDAPVATAQANALELGRNDAFGGVSSAQLSPAGTSVDSRLASTVPQMGGKRDLVGTGGHQDDLANQIYQPGHTVGFGG